MKTIYLDYNASTPVDPEVIRAMQPYIETDYGNPSSVHARGVPLRKAINLGRKQVADLIDCSPDEVTFTSGASECNNWVIKGAAFSYRERGNHIITSQIEHPSVIHACGYLEKQGARVTYLPVDRYGSVDPAEVEKAVTPQTILISVMHANNEVGTLQPISEISRIAKRHGIVFHTDAAQSIGKIPVSVSDLGVDLLSVAGHKLYAPKGVGALYIRTGIIVEPLIHGAGQESGHRSGTENAAYIVALGKACELAQHDLPEREPQISELRDLFQRRLKERLGDCVVINGHPECRLPNTLHVSFANTTGVDLLAKIPELCASTGAACHSGQIHLSATLKAMGIAPEIGVGAVRFSLGRYTTGQEIQDAAALIENAYRKNVTF